jgi:hypothetical protein
VAEPQRDRRVRSWQGLRIGEVGRSRHRGYG